MTNIIADRRLYLNAAGAVVEQDDPSRTELLAAAGTPLTDEQAQRYGLRLEGGRVAWGPDTPERRAVYGLRPLEAAPPDLETLKKADLIKLAEQAGVSPEGTKAELIARLGG